MTGGFLLNPQLHQPKYCEMQGKIYDIDGSYITIPQIKFYLNREENAEKLSIILSSSPFRKYLKVCKVYNLISDLIDEYPEDGFFYWDEIKGCVSFAFKEESSIAMLLGALDVTILDFGNGKDV
mgnify:FL=1